MVLGRRLRPVDALCVGGFLLGVIYPLALIPFEPALLAVHPILVEAFLGTVESLVTAGAFARIGQAALWLAILAPLICSDLLDPFSWWLGQRFGRRILDSPAGARYRTAFTKAEGLFRRWGPWALLISYYLPVPNALVYIIAGESGMSLPVFIALDLAGTALGLVPFVMLGYVIGQSAVDLARLINHYAPISAAVLIALFVAYQLLRARAAARRSPEAAAPRAPAH